MRTHFVNATQLKSYTEIQLKYIGQANCQIRLLFSCFRLCNGNALHDAKSMPLKTLSKKHNQAINEITTANSQCIMSSNSIIKQKTMKKIISLIEIFVNSTQMVFIAFTTRN